DLMRTAASWLAVRHPHPHLLPGPERPGTCSLPRQSPSRPVSRLDVDRATRLYETGDVAQLVLNFGQYRGATLLQVAAMDPDYVRQLALAAQRPEVRAAARKLVIALEQVAAHRPRTARPAGRRAPASG